MNEENSRDEQMADFRYSVVADLANPYLDAAKRRQLIREKAERVWEIPGIGRKRLSEGCILKWLSVYRTHGKAGLQPKRRRDWIARRGQKNPRHLVKVDRSPPVRGCASARIPAQAG